LIDYLQFYVPIKNFSLKLYGDVTVAGEGLQNLGLCSAFIALSREGSLSCHTCCDTGPRLLKGMWRIYNSNPDLHRFMALKVIE
jgi:hypothetical protein